MKYLFFITIFTIITNICNAQLSFTKNDEPLGEKYGRCAASGDIDNDGDIDIIIGYSNNFNEDTNRIWINIGDGNFELSNLFIGTNTDQVKLADLNGDNYLDIIFANSGIFDTINWIREKKPNEIWINDGNGQFINSYEVIDSNSSFIQIIDFNNDGSPDINIGNSIWLNNGEGNFTNSGISISDTNIQNFTLGDLDNDNDIDAFTAGFDFISGAPCSIYFNDGENKLVLDTTQNIGNSQTSNVSLGDIDNDGDQDAFIANFHNSNGTRQKDEIWLNNGYGIFTKGDFSTLQKATYSATFVDIDNDGDLDIYTNYSDANNAGYISVPQYIWLNNGSGEFTYFDAGIKGIPGFDINDFNGDGNLDILAFDVTGNFIWFNSTITQAQNLNSKKQDIYLYPNPAQKTLHIKRPGLSQKEANYKIFDLNGKTLQEGMLTGNTIDVSELTKSVYFLNLNIEDETISGKFIIR